MPPILTCMFLDRSGLFQRKHNTEEMLLDPQDIFYSNLFFYTQNNFLHFPFYIPKSRDILLRGIKIIIGLVKLI